MVNDIFEHFKSRPGKRMLYEKVCVAEGREFSSDEKRKYGVMFCARDCELPEQQCDIVNVDGNFFVSGRTGRYVIYKQLYESDFPVGTIWARVYEDFFGEKLLGDGSCVRRFRKVS